MNSRWAARSFAVLAMLLSIGRADAAIKPLVITNIDVPEGNGKFLIFSVSNATAPVLEQRRPGRVLGEPTDHERWDIGRHRHLLV